MLVAKMRRDIPCNTVQSLFSDLFVVSFRRASSCGTMSWLMFVAHSMDKGDPDGDKIDKDMVVVVDVIVIVVVTAAVVGVMVVVISVIVVLVVVAFVIVLLVR